ncbi:exodeoxyribonuclease V subunit beta [Desulfurivibrio sp. D14AmB]|uniref:exodeoxyribonuclease V subunit beta n=1 Tax=Desulfurivibrio sp. D14AmB TaxID=3374370 RepID=UPI00376F3637
MKVQRENHTPPSSSPTGSLPFAPETLPEAPIQLIEASAGTGKTHSISSLYLRFILERELPVERILVLSFTEAATAELHERLRARLQAALALFEGRIGSRDHFLNGLLANSGDRQRDRLLLQKALTEIDQAAVTTIHSFCHQMLQQGAFESGMPFELELVSESHLLLEEIVRDYLATVFHGDDSRLLALLPLGEGLDSWRRIAEIATRHRDFPVLNGLRPAGEETAPAAGEISKLIAAALAAFNLARQCWRENEETIVAILKQGEFRVEVSRRIDAGLLGQLAAYLAEPQPDSFLVPEGSERLTPEKFRDPEAKVCPKRAIAKGRVPEHPFFPLWSAYLTASARLAHHYRLHTSKGLIEFARRQLPARLYAARLQSFDDLLHRLAQALTGAKGYPLAQLMANRYPVALIDEFQDTDPVQYAIFQAVYGQPKPSPPTRLILIGDPKQAIYGFRGADIFAYLRAARDSGGQRYTMTVNWRADGGMVAAVNALFGGVANPFLVPEIGFPRVEPRPEAGDCWQGGDFGGDLPLQFLTLPPQLADHVAGVTSNRPVKGKVEKLLPALVAADIAGLLAGGAGINLPGGFHPLRPPDIAILVRSNRQAEAMQAALREQGIKAVVYSPASVFQSKEARQLTILLHGLQEGAGDPQRRGAMLTELLAATPRELADLTDEEINWQVWLDNFSRWRLLWRERGFMAMARTLGAEKRLAARLLTSPDGERRLTNYRHLFELLHQQERQGHLRPAALGKWLDAKIAGGNQGGDADELRLESDEAAVRVLTIHRSKGLEFPVVYCPYLWKGEGRRSGRREGLFTFHDPADQRVGKIVIDPNADQRLRRREEEFAEELRLLYVAVTRARHCCLVPWEAATDYEHSALAYLLHGGDLAALGREEILAMLTQRVAGENHWGIRRFPLPESLGRWRNPEDEVQTVAPSCRSLSRPIAPGWRVGSFSQLAAAQHPGERDPSGGRDYDGGDSLALASPTITPKAATLPPHPLLASRVPLAEFPAGLAAGNLIHRIFELISFTDASAHREIITAQTAAFGFGARGPATTTLERAVAAVLHTPLTDEEPFCLAEIGDGQRLNELPFIFPVGRQGGVLGPARLAAAFAEHQRQLPPGYPELLRTLQFVDLAGFLKGFIDLVFQWRQRWYIIDYKSNLLGSSFGDYCSPRLAEPMSRHHYILQYHIYTVALHRYLAARLPGYNYQRHIGGVFYLFLRGMHPELGPAAGVFAHRPPGALVETLSRDIFG